VRPREDNEAGDVARETNRTPADATLAATGGGEVAGVRLSHPDKVLFPKQGLTKSDLASYYQAIAERMLPHIRDRPLSLVRCPQGRASKCFFQKHDQGGFPAAMKTLPITESSGERASYFYIDNLAGLIAGVQVGVLEFHLWGCRRDRLEQPDRLVFDLDPDETLNFADVSRAAIDVRDRLETLGLQSWAMVTGGKGIHVVIPLARRNGWEEVKIFARGVARQFAEEQPDRFIAKASKASRTGRIFIDWLRNDRGSTAICPYSSRAREGAPVAMPVSWEDIGRLKAANAFTITNAPQRVREVPDPWADMTGQSLARKLIAGFA
jgi:bifunctional non-homologous end joining protein LigD